MENAAGDRLILALDSDEAVAKLKFPKNVKEIVIDGCGHTLTFSGAAAIKPDRKLTLYDITIKVEKKDKPQNITLTATAGGLVLEKVTFDGKKTTVNAKKGDLTLIGVTAENLFVRGDPKTELTVGGTVNAAKITGFGKVLLNGTLTASETLNIGAITFVEGSVLNAPKNAAITFKNGLSGTGTINLADGFKPLTIKGTIGGKITLTADKPLAEGQLIFKSKLTDLIDVFDISGIAPVVNDGTYEYRLYVKSSKVYLRAFKMQVGDTTYCEWADIMSGITKAGKSGESYSLNLLGNVDLGKTFKLPTKGKYGGLTIDGNGHTLTYSGSSITLTGNLKLTNLTLTAMAKNGCTIKQGSFTLDAGGAELVNCKIK